MKDCFVCNEPLVEPYKKNCECGRDHVEYVCRPDDSAHMDCVWKAAKLAVYGYNASIVKGEDKCHLP